LAKPSFTFHNVSASAGFHKEFAADLNWYSNISHAEIQPSVFFSIASFEMGFSFRDKSNYTTVKKWTNFSEELLE
jgi:iron complex outermembrane receptor protein